MSRILPFKTVYNFRDFGRYDNSRGGTVAGGKLFRSANLNKLAGDDIGKFLALDISAIIDMRYAPERVKQPNKLPEAYSAVNLVYEATDGRPPAKVAPHEAFMDRELHSGADARNYMMSSYGRRPLDAGFISLVQKTLRHMIETGDNVLVHCAAGKDRTGTLVAIIQHILGVSRDEIIYDYMLTMEAVDIELIIETVLSAISKQYGREFSADMLRPMFGVSEEYLQSAFAAMENIDDYLANIIGLSAADRQALNAHYTHR